MSYQVGVACFATLAGAGSATCSQYTPVTALVEHGAVIRTVSCASADPTTGGLNLQITSTPVDGSPGVTAFVSQPIAFADCLWPQYVSGGLQVFAALLGVVVTVKAWGYLQNYLESQARGNE